MEGGTNEANDERKTIYQGCSGWKIQESRAKDSFWMSLLN
jgi:hypothetical protein